MSISSLYGTSTALTLLYREAIHNIILIILVALDLTTVKGIAIYNYLVAEFSLAVV